MVGYNVFFIFNNFINQYRLHTSCQQGYKLLESGKKEEAFNAFNSLRSQDPCNPYLRSQILILGAELNKEVHLPTGRPLDERYKKLFTPR